MFTYTCILFFSYPFFSNDRFISIVDDTTILWVYGFFFYLRERKRESEKRRVLFVFCGKEKKGKRERKKREKKGENF